MTGHQPSESFVRDVQDAFAECVRLQKKNADLETALRRIASLGEKNVQKYAQEIARAAIKA